MGTEDLSQATGVVRNDIHSPIRSESSCSRSSIDKDTGVATCRVCQCAESDKRGDAALEFLGINPPLLEAGQSNGVLPFGSKDVSVESKSQFVEFIGPEGEVFVCNNDLEIGASNQHDTLLKLGCSCKNDLALVHYACALKWFVNHGSTVCEICGHVAKNIKTADLKKVLVSLKEYEALRERTASGNPNPAQVQNSIGVDPDAVAAVRRQRLSEISLFFSAHRTSVANNFSMVMHGNPEQPATTITEDVVSAQNPATRWAVEGTGILLAVGLLTVTLAWLIAPRVGKKTARSGLHILLAGVCALTVVIFFRCIVLTRIRYGPARYWAILFVFWFLVFGIWASRTHGTHKT